MMLSVDSSINKQHIYTNIQLNNYPHERFINLLERFIIESNIWIDSIHYLIRQSTQLSAKELNKNDKLNNFLDGDIFLDILDEFLISSSEYLDVIKYIVDENIVSNVALNRNPEVNRVKVPSKKVTFSSPLECTLLNHLDNYCNSLFTAKYTSNLTVDGDLNCIQYNEVANCNTEKQSNNKIQRLHHSKPVECMKRGIHNDILYNNDNPMLFFTKYDRHLRFNSNKHTIYYGCNAIISNTDDGRDVKLKSENSVFQYTYEENNIPKIDTISTITPLVTCQIEGSKSENCVNQAAVINDSITIYILNVSQINQTPNMLVIKTILPVSLHQITSVIIEECANQTAVLNESKTVYSMKMPQTERLELWKVESVENSISVLIKEISCVTIENCINNTSVIKKSSIAYSIELKIIDSFEMEEIKEILPVLVEQLNYCDIEDVVTELCISKSSAVVLVQARITEIQIWDFEKTHILKHATLHTLSKNAIGIVQPKRCCTILSEMFVYETTAYMNNVFMTEDTSFISEKNEIETFNNVTVVTIPVDDIKECMYNSSRSNEYLHNNCMSTSGVRRNQHTSSVPFSQGFILDDILLTQPFKPHPHSIDYDETISSFTLEQEDDDDEDNGSNSSSISSEFVASANVSSTYLLSSQPVYPTIRPAKYRRIDDQIVPDDTMSSVEIEESLYNAGEVV